ncbi:copper homeostasis protein cutC homolog isoform X2 [Watersipora subatra]|uniref:copper homeostasis protein cutC homolog isoform X2 n=1 Tax=Watersipora subatra TaxID=2589382 RepID=UPI00355B4F03
MEVCVDSIISAISAEKGGATRLELCANLLEGGTTPSLGLALTVKTKVSIPVFALIRPRGGDFLYTDDEFQVMKMDVIAMCEGGIDGIVIGLLKRDGTVDSDRCAELIALAKDRVSSIKVTFHRAFDMTGDYEKALEDIVNLGCERILTSGLDSSALEGTLVIKKCIELANDRIIIMPGGGINERNIERILEQTAAKEFHCSARKNEDSLMECQNTHVCMGTSLCSQEYVTRVADEQKLQRILMTAARCWKIVV